MLDGFICAGAATPVVRVADCDYNCDNTIALMRQGADRGAKLLVFPELCLTAYTCGDLFLQDALLAGAKAALRRVAEATAGLELLAFVGVPLVVGGKLYNCAAAVCGGEVLGVVPKSCPPNYGEFYELRNFCPAPDECGEIELFGKTVPFGTKLLFECSALPEFTVAAELCEDLWVPVPPSCAHAAAGAHIIVNLSASDEVVGKADYRRRLVQGQSARLVCGYIYSDAGEGESTSDMVFGGHDLVAENGALLAESEPMFTGLVLSEIDVRRLAYERRRLNTYSAAQEGYVRIPFDMALTQTTLTRTVHPHPFIPSDEGDRAARCESILAIQTAGLSSRVRHTRAKRLVLGVSGGLDSTLALLVCARAVDALNMPRSAVLALTMPGFGTTARTRGNAETLCRRLGVSLRSIAIGEAVRRHFLDIGHDEGVRDVTYENAQARERTQVLMDIANQEGGLVVGTGDLSELALGWATYNGDHMSMYGVNASVPKTLIRHIVKSAALSCGDDELACTLEDILDTPVSPELLPADEHGGIAQKTEQLVGPYELHDFFLYYALRWGFAPLKLRRLALYAFSGQYGEGDVDYWLKNFYRRFFAQQFKRSCLPDGPKVGTVSLSPRGDWRMPSDAASALWLKEL